MDLNEIKNRAKDLLADLTEPRSERDDRRDQDGVDDPAARTDRLSTTTGEPVADHRAEHLDPPSSPGRTPEHVVDPREVAPRDEPTAAPLVEEWDEGVDRPASAGMPEHRVLAETREPVQPAATGPTEPVQPGVAATGADPVPRADPGPGPLDAGLVGDGPLGAGSVDTGSVDAGVDDGFAHDGRHHLREPQDQGSSAAGDTVAAAAASAGVSRTDTTPGDPERLVTAERAQSYGSRWDEVKGEFVDEPRQAVAKADALVGELLDELGQLFTRQRREIEQDLDNNDASTEDLRVALRRYRSFFDRLLSV